jgi:asparagine synthase (glutamine-hydrolysing)
LYWVRLLKEIFNYSIKHRSTYGIKSFIFFLLPHRFGNSTRIKKKAYLNKQFIQKYGQSNNFAGILYGSETLQDAFLDHFEYKLEHLLKWEDRNSMWFSLEARVPFLDYHFVERVLATPSNMIIRNGMTKYILREGMKGILPEKIRLRRDKIGFETPQNEWFRTQEWQEIIFDILNSNSFKQRNLINPDIALKQYRNHLTGKTDLSSEIWKWLHLELWFREFID